MPQLSDKAAAADKKKRPGGCKKQRREIPLFFLAGDISNSYQNMRTFERP